MALSAKEAAALIVIGLDEAMLKGQGVAARTIKSIGRAAVKVAPYVARGAVATAPVVGRTAATLAAANPISTGVGLGASFLASGPGQDLLQRAEDRGAMDRIRAQQAYDLWVYENITRPAELAGSLATSPTTVGMVRSAVKRKTSKYNKAIKGGMAAVKKSKFIGSKGTINNAKKAFTTVSKVTSKVNKGKKVSTKGVTGLIARTVRKIL